MTFSEDPTSPPAPFSGDGSIFDHPDVLLQSPTTNERVVDTQSGFLVVIKRMGERLALSCKRRVGTPPSSSVLLTPDESLKLSKILASSVVGLDEPSHEVMTTRADIGGRRRFSFNPSQARKQSNLLSKAKTPAAIAGALALLSIAVGGSFVLGMKLAPAPKATPKINLLADENVDRFARNFVGEMLDFNPDTYKFSQVQAMSSMSPELLEKYWKETNFPLSRHQLKGLPQGTTVMIQKIAHDHPAPDTAVADIYAELVKIDSKIATPVHIKLRLGINAEGGIKVLEQEDLSSAVK